MKYSSGVVKIQTDGSNPPLFCIHGVGFSVFIYQTLAVNLGCNQPVYVIQARELDGNETIGNIQEIASDYIQEMRSVQPEGPYFLAGLSKGGNYAMEMAQQLQVQDQKVALLAMFDSHAHDSITLLTPLPRFVSSLHYLLQYSVPRIISKRLRSGSVTVLTKLQKKIRAFGQTNYLPKNRTTMVTEVARRENSSLPFPKLNLLEQGMNRMSQYILEHSPWSFLTPPIKLKDTDTATSNTLKQLEGTFNKGEKDYKSDLYSGKIILLRAKESPPGYQLDPELGWGRIAKEGVEVYMVPGHHTSMMESPILAKRLGACIENAIQRPTIVEALEVHNDKILPAS
ncbi:MAG: DUF2974 domain-containing protein [Chroococcidiopsidaceae cyanobacterium CP_BM_RX_35]|nr:DUF2974 domain-containing protein [Chroococcidiopsidaceae cyanobacterium CP_BM_RX_35]